MSYRPFSAGPSEGSRRLESRRPQGATKAAYKSRLDGTFGCRRWTFNKPLDLSREEMNRTNAEDQRGNQGVEEAWPGRLRHLEQHGITNSTMYIQKGKKSNDLLHDFVPSLRDHPPGLYEHCSVEKYPERVETLSERRTPCAASRIHDHEENFQGLTPRREEL